MISRVMLVTLNRIVMTLSLALLVRAISSANLNNTQVSHQKTQSARRSQIPRWSNYSLSDKIWGPFREKIMKYKRMWLDKRCPASVPCEFVFTCWMTVGSSGPSCGRMHTCCSPRSARFKPPAYGSVVNDPLCGTRSMPPSPNLSTRIVHGSGARWGQYPWMAYLTLARSGQFMCGGSLVSSQHVVTAMHCVEGRLASDLLVTLGDLILTGNFEGEKAPPETFFVKQILGHPFYLNLQKKRYYSNRFDVAVLLLDREVKYKEHIRPICLPNKNYSAADKAMEVAGWGFLNRLVPWLPRQLQTANVIAMDSKDCQMRNYYRGIMTLILDDQLCAGHFLNSIGPDACKGDSGGPLMVNEDGRWYLAGVVSTGWYCGFYPGIYHRISASADWISHLIHQTSSASER